MIKCDGSALFHFWFSFVRLSLRTHYMNTGINDKHRGNDNPYTVQEEEIKPEI